MDNGTIDFVDEISVNASYVGVVPFVGENVLLSQVFSRGFEFPADRRQPSEVYEESAKRILMEQCDATPLIMGVLATEHFIGDHGEDVYIAYYWAVVEQSEVSESMGVGMSKTFAEKQLSDHPMVANRKDLYDVALNYAKVVAKELSKVG